jgi:hypothetical protein
MVRIDGWLAVSDCRKAIGDRQIVAPQAMIRRIR